MNTEDHRQKFHHLERGSRVNLAIRDEQDPYRCAELRGRVGDVERGQAMRDRIEALSRNEGDPHPLELIRTERVTVVVVPERPTVPG